MALIRSSLLSDITGSIGGTTYARARGGSYARNRTVPINPKTQNQDYVRGMFGTVSSMYSNLSAQEIEQWQAWASQLRVHNRLGEEYTPSAKQAYVMSGVNLMQVGLSPLTVAPTATDGPAFDIGKLAIVAQQDGGELSNLTYTDVSGQVLAQGAIAQVRFSPPQIPARGQSFRNQVRGSMQSIPGHTTFSTPFVGLSLAQGLFGGGESVPASSGQVIVSGIRLVRTDNGLASSWLYKTVEIVNA